MSAPGRLTNDQLKDLYEQSGNEAYLLALAKRDGVEPRKPRDWEKIVILGMVCLLVLGTVVAMVAAVFA